MHPAWCNSKVSNDRQELHLLMILVAKAHMRGTPARRGRCRGWMANDDGLMSSSRRGLIEEDKAEDKTNTLPAANPPQKAFFQSFTCRHSSAAQLMPENVPTKAPNPRLLRPRACRNCFGRAGRGTLVPVSILGDEAIMVGKSMAIVHAIPMVRPRNSPSTALVEQGIL